MKRITVLTVGVLLCTAALFANEENADGVKWNAHYDAGDKAVHLVIDTQGLEKTSHLSSVRLRFLVDGGQSKIQVTIREKEVKAGTVLQEVVSLGSNSIHSLTPDMLFYKVSSESGQSDPKPHQLSPTAELMSK